MVRRRTQVVGVLVGACILASGVGAGLLLPHSSTSSAASSPASAASEPPSTTSRATSASVTKKTRVVTIGDSIMAGLNLQSTQAWPSLLATADGIPVDNLGCSGAGFIAVGSCGQDYAGLIPAAAADHPDVVIIQSSDNDDGQDATALQSATTHTIDAIHAALPHAQIIAFGTLWDQNMAAPSEIAESSTDLQQAVGAVGGSYLSLGQPLAGNQALLQSDDEHPSVAGQRVLLHSIQNALAGAQINL